MVQISDTVRNPNRLGMEHFSKTLKSECSDFRHLLYLFYWLKKLNKLLHIWSGWVGIQGWTGLQVCLLCSLLLLDKAQSLLRTPSKWSQRVGSPCRSVMAQMARQKTHDWKVLGSIPRWGKKIFLVFSWLLWSLWDLLLSICHIAANTHDNK